MADATTGIVFSQNGTPVKGSADYQRVYDSRWRFVEIEWERTIRTVLPARPVVDSGARYYDEVKIMDHNLGFLPVFETDFPDQRYNYAMQAGASMYADTKSFFFRRFVTTNGAEAQDLTFNIRLYNLNAMEEYIAPKGLPQGTSSARGDIGVKFLDGKTKGVGVGDDSPTGFSVDSTKKMLSIHRSGIAKINDYSGRGATVTAINTTTDVLTIAVESGSTGKRKDISWAKKPGSAVVYFPQDSATFPGGMQNNGASSYTMYTIPVSSTQVKLATSYENALQGISIDLTSAGALPGTMNMSSTPGSNEDAIYHNVGYPPTFLLSPIYTTFDDYNYIAPERYYIGPMVDNLVARVMADKDYIRIRGVQSVFSGWYNYVILKDPAEIAR